MKVSERLRPVSRLFLDTGPVIYYVEKNPHYIDVTQAIFDRLDNGAFTAVTSPVTLTECLIVPYRLNRPDVAQTFTDLIVNGGNVSFVLMDEGVATTAAELRARYNVSLPDALQLATAITAGCDAFLTNDQLLKRVTEIDVMVVDDLEPD